MRKCVKTNERMDRIEAELACIKLDTVKMNVHINFIEKAYSIVRAPLNYIFNLNCLQLQIEMRCANCRHIIYIYYMSYAPTINRRLVSLKTMKRRSISDCNNKLAFTLKAPLQIKIGKKCHNYTTNRAKTWLLRNLKAKHVNPDKIVPPKQLQSNCWFNAMFVTFFISDKGRKFFHFFRQLMIEGKQSDGTTIPDSMKDAFAMLNFAIESALTGNEYARVLNTNKIIKQIYKTITKTQGSVTSIYNVDEAGNPFTYYLTLMRYLHNNTLDIVKLNPTSNWQAEIREQPHIIIFEIYDDQHIFNPLNFTINNANYVLDGSIVRDTKQQHFCSTLTVEHKEYGFDGLSFHRIQPFEWKAMINVDAPWGFKGSTDYDRTPFQWNFQHAYQQLFYYRT